MRHTKRWKILRGRSQRKLKQQLIPCELMSPNFYKSYKLFELIPLSSFIALLKFTEMCAFQMRHNNVSQEGVLALTLSLSPSLSLRRQTSNISSNQTADKQFIKNRGMPSFTESQRSTCTQMHNKYQASKQKSSHPSTRLDRTISWTLVRSSKQMRGSKKKRERAGER